MPFDFRSLLGFPSVTSLALPCFFRPSLHGHYPASSLLRRLLTSSPLSRRRSPQVRCRIFPLVPSGSTWCVSDDFWASLFPANLPPAPGLTAGSCSYGRRFAIRFFRLHALRFRYGCRHQLRRDPFISIDSAHAGHTGTGLLACHSDIPNALDHRQSSTLCTKPATTGFRSI